MDMTINKINIKQITFAAAAALLLAGCASEELADEIGRAHV